MSDPASRSDASWEAPLLIPLAQLDRRYLGYFTVDVLGDRGSGRLPLIAANVEITEAVLEQIHANASKLGPGGGPLAFLRLKRRRVSQVPAGREILSPESRRVVFTGLHASLRELRERLIQSGIRPEGLLGASEEEAVRQLRTARLAAIDPSFRDQLEEILHQILKDPEQGALFACVEESGNDLAEHGVRVFMLGAKLFTRFFHIQEEKIRHHKRLYSYGLGLLFHDTGMILLPQTILQKNLRIPKEEVDRIREEIRLRGLDPSLATTIQAVNDPRFVYAPAVERRLRSELGRMRVLVEEGILTPSQYAALRLFPSSSCLSEEERVLLEKHPMWGWELVREACGGNPFALDIVAHHHQRLDGSGYPATKASISIEAQIAACADCFDALVSERPYREAKGYDVAFGILDAMTRAEAGQVPKLSRQVYELLCASVPKYPVGSFLRIEGGEYQGWIGQVIETSPYAIDRPSFILIRDRNGKRLTEYPRFTRADYDGSFRILGLPYTEAVQRAILAPVRETAEVGP